MEPSVGSRDVRVAQLLEEYIAAAQAGRPLDRDGFLAAHADVREELEAAIYGIDFVGLAAEELERDGVPSEPPVAGTLGDFRLIREVGRGGMGVVYEAEQASLGRRVALKVLPFAAVLDQRQLQRFKHEAQAAALLHHTNIVPVYSVGTDRGVHYYAMEYVEGRTLAQVNHELRAARRRERSADRARARRPSPRAEPEEPEPKSSSEAQALVGEGTTETPEYCRAVARIGVQAAEALDHAHEQGVVHRDIKPANLMVDAKGHLWITDFGLATSRANTQLTLTGAIVGTLGYMSPEQALGKRVPVDHRTDIYSLGVTLLESLTLEPVFPAEDPRQVIQDIAFKNPAPPRRANAAVPQALETILLKAVAKDPESRYATAQEMADDLRRFLGNEPVRARRAPLLDRVSLWTKRHRAAVAAGVCVLAIAVVALVVDAVRGAAAQKGILDALDKEKKSAARAEANLAKASEAVDRMLTQVAADELAGIPGLDPVRTKLLAEAVGLYDDLLASSPDDPGVRRDAARAFRRTARFHSMHGDAATADRLYERAKSLLSSLAPEDGPWHPALGDLSELEREHAARLVHANRAADAVPVFERAVLLAQRGVDSGTDAQEATHRLVDALLSHGHICGHLQKMQESLASLERAESCATAAIARWPDDKGFHEELAQVFNERACRAEAVEHLAETEELWRRALKEDDLADCRAADSSAFQNRTEHLTNLTHLLVKTGRAEEALPFARAAFDARSRRAAEFPRYPAYAATAIESQGLLAVALFRSGHAEDAKPLVDDAFARCDRLLGEFRDSRLFRGFLAPALCMTAAHLAGARRFAESNEAYRRGTELLAQEAKAETPHAMSFKVLSTSLEDWLAHCAATMKPEEQVRIARDAVSAAERATTSADALPEYREMLAKSLQRLGLSLAGAGDLDGGADALRRSVEAYRETAKETPGVPSLRRLTATSLADWAECLRKSKKLDEADARCREAVSIFEELVAKDGADEECLSQLAFALNSSGELAEARGRPADSEPFVRRACELQEKCAALRPGDFERRVRLGRYQMHAARLALLGGRLADAEPLLLAALADSRKLNAEDPSNRDAKFAIGACAGYLAQNVLVSPARRGEAGPYYEEAIRTMTETAKTPKTLKSLLSTQVGYGAYLRDAGRFADAERELTAATAIVRNAGAEGAQFYAPHALNAFGCLGDVLRELGKYRETIEAWNRAYEIDPHHGELTCNLVIVLADAPDASLRDTPRAVALARKLLESAPPQRTKPGEADAKAALKSLSLALACDGQWKESLEALAAVVEQGGDAGGASLVYQALDEANLGDLAAAREHYSAAVAWLDANPQKEERFARRRAEVESILAAAR